VRDKINRDGQIKSEVRIQKMKKKGINLLVLEAGMQPQNAIFRWSFACVFVRHPTDYEPGKQKNYLYPAGR
jgi:hypothetical protein